MPKGLAPRPPLELIRFTGLRDQTVFERTGQENFKYVLDLGALGPSGKILEVGSGCGKLAIPLTDYLGAEGTYEGFDIAKTGIDWCDRTITPSYPNFRFRHFDIFNKKYNPSGRQRAAEFRFPFSDASFDLAVLFSVFTHMLPLDMGGFLGEIARVLKRGGKSVISYYLFDEKLLAEQIAGKENPFFHMMDDGKNIRLEFRHEFAPGCRILSQELPELACAYEEQHILRVYQTHEMRIEKIHYGRWCGRPNPLSHQDLIVAMR